MTVCVPVSWMTVWSGPLVNDGASLTGLTVMVNVCVPLVSVPPLAVPPSSCSVTDTVAVPNAFAARGVGQIPSGVDGGLDGEQALLSLVTSNVTVCADSLAGPAAMPVANPATVCGPASSRPSGR